jgi:hypothetical protein
LEGARDRYMCVVNLALAHKWKNDEKQCAEIVGAEDWTAASLDFRLAISVLKDDFDEAVSLMKQIGISGEVTKENYEEWPLFNKFRRTKRFLETYRDIFKTNLEVRTVPSEVASTLALPSNSKPASKRRTKAKAGKALQHQPTWPLQKPPSPLPLITRQHALHRPRPSGQLPLPCRRAHRRLEAMLQPPVVGEFCGLGIDAGL